MTPFAVSDAVWETLIQGFYATVLGIALAWIGRRTGQLVAAQKGAALKVEAVKTALEETNVTVTEKLASIEAVGKATHILVNNAMSVELKENAALSRWKAERSKDPADVRAAEVAERKYREHMKKQAVVDSHEGGV